MARPHTDILSKLDQVLLTDGGLETTLIFHDGVDLPCFAAFDLLRSAEGEARIRAYYRRYLDLARALRMGFVLESPTWRANPDWGDRLGYSQEALAGINRHAVEMMQALRAEYAGGPGPILISGCFGPRSDAYRPDAFMSAAQARDYHLPQMAVFAQAGVDFASAFTLAYVNEAIGIVQAAEHCGLAAVISFTVETDGRLPGGQTLGAAIEEVDAVTGGAPLHYMINCAHPAHFADVLETAAGWRHRIRGIRANASQRSHAELDEATALDSGDPADLGRRYRALFERLPGLRVVGGCCGTDLRHVEAIARALS